MNKGTRFIIAEVIILCSLVIGLYCYMKSECSVERTAETYFTKMINGDWDRVYDELELPESEFINREMFVRTQSYRGGIELTSYIVENNSKINKHNDESGISLGKDVNIRYRQKGESYDYSYTVSLNKQKNKRYFLFDSWKVSASDYITKDYCIVAPTGSKVMLNDILLDNKFITSTSSEGFAHYKIPYLFEGRYRLTATKENMKDMVTDIYVDSDMSDAGYSMGQFELKDEIKEQLAKKAIRDYATIYEQAMKKGGFNTVESLFITDTELLNEARQNYQQLFEDVAGAEGFGVQTMNFSKVKVSECCSEDIVYITIDYSYTSEYTYKHYSTGQLTWNNDGGESSFSMSYKFEDGNWLINTIK